MLVPRVDITPLVAGPGDDDAVAAAIDAACRDTGFFSIVGHGVDPALRTRLDARLVSSSRSTSPRRPRSRCHAAAARGAVGFPSAVSSRRGCPIARRASTSEPSSAPTIRACAGVPLHGPNLFPRRPAALRDAVLDYLDAMTQLGHAVMRGVALALGLPADWFARELTADPTILFRIFCYPPRPTATRTKTSGACASTPTTGC